MKKIIILALMFYSTTAFTHITESVHVGNLEEDVYHKTCNTYIEGWYLEKDGDASYRKLVEETLAENGYRILKRKPKIKDFLYIYITANREPLETKNKFCHLETSLTFERPGRLTRERILPKLIYAHLSEENGMYDCTKLIKEHFTKIPLCRKFSEKSPGISDSSRKVTSEKTEFYIPQKSSRVMIK